MCASGQTSFPRTQVRWTHAKCAGNKFQWKKKVEIARETFEIGSETFKITKKI